jgi:hypothetical protein
MSDDDRSEQRLELHIGSAIEQLAQVLDNSWALDERFGMSQPAADLGMATMYLDEAACELVVIGAFANEPDTDVHDFWRAHRLVEGAAEGVRCAIEALQRIEARHGW